MSLISIFKSQTIEFFVIDELMLDILEKPGPSAKFMPEWYKTLPTRDKNQRDHFGSIGKTSKKCLPMLDAMSDGYIIPLAGDIHVRTNEDASLIDITQNQFAKLTDEHEQWQVGPKFPFKKNHLIKFLNYFIIKTPPGYSCLFIPPINHLETRFSTLGGIVDTDKYDRPINFPSVWMANNYDDFVHAGTPLVQCIPFKRNDRLKKYNVRHANEKEKILERKTALNQENREGYYSRFLREKK